MSYLTYRKCDVVSEHETMDGRYRYMVQMRDSGGWHWCIAGTPVESTRNGILSFPPEWVTLPGYGDKLLAHCARKYDMYGEWRYTPCPT